MTSRLPRAFVFSVLALAACGHSVPQRAPVSGTEAARLSAFEAPRCGGRIFVTMGFNQKYPGDDSMRVAQGDFYLFGTLIDTVSKNPEVTVLDVPAGKADLSWVPGGDNHVDRSRIKQNTLSLKLADQETAFVVLDLYDDTPVTTGLVMGARGQAGAGIFRTEVIKAADKTAFTGKRITFHKALDKPCSGGTTTVTAPPSVPKPQAAPPASQPKPAMPPSPLVANPQEPQQPVVLPQPSATPAPAPAAPKAVQAAPVPRPVPVPVPQPPALQQAAPAAPSPVAPVTKPEPPKPEMPKPPVVAARPTTTLVIPEPPQAAAGPDDEPLPAQFYYIVNARSGAPAFTAQRADDAPLYTFPDKAELNVLETSADMRWLKVKIPSGRTAYVPATAVTRGMKVAPEVKAPK